MALEENAPSISYTYTEPTVFIEYALETMKIAKDQAIKNIWISNGYMSKEALKLTAPFIDAANIDLKSFSDEFYKKYCGALIRPILDNLIEIKNKNIWLEITTLIIPSLNDSEKTLKQIARFIRSNLGPETPWHISQFNSEISWKLSNIPDTPIQSIQKAWEIGKSEGLKYVYSGNVPGHPTEDTYCSNCKTRIIERTGYQIKRYDENGKCPNCKKSANLTLN
jgi:pyruvate formate lyase activating enzyme